MRRPPEYSATELHQAVASGALYGAVVALRTGATLSLVFQIAVQTEFCAAHALTIAGLVEPVHGHNWRVTAVIAGDALDADGLLCDFHTVEAVLRDITAAWNNRNLNDSEAFNRTSPTAENVAKVIADSLAERLNGSLAPHAWVASVSVTEAPGCVATYLRPHP